LSSQRKTKKDREGRGRKKGKKKEERRKREKKGKKWLVSENKRMRFDPNFHSLGLLEVKPLSRW
jgi:hypothetical protein